jgi:hypothetical protein
MSLLRCLLVLLLACSSPGPAAAQAMPAGVELPLDVRLAVRVLNINRIQEVQREVSAAVEFTQRWTDPALRFDRIAAGSERLDLVAAEAERRLAAIWQPGIAIENMIGQPREASEFGVAQHGDAAQAGQMQVIEMRVRDQNQVDRRQVMRVEAGVAKTLHRAMPERPVRIDEDVSAFHLHQEARVSQPRDPDLMRGRVGHRIDLMPWLARGEQGWNQDVAEELKIALLPALLWQEPHLVLIFHPLVAKPALPGSEWAT